MNNQRKRTINARVHYRKGYWSAVAVLLVGLVAVLPPQPLLAGQAPFPINISFSIGSIATQLDITNPVAQPATGLFKSTLHIHARDDTQTPPFNADLVAMGQAADSDTLIGGFGPAALIVKQDLLASMTFQQASADAQAKTGVTITFFNDAVMVEYALLLFLVLVGCMDRIVTIQPGLGNDACAIRAKLEAGVAALGFQNPPDPCGRSAITP
jgi:hypothetical protein